MAKITFSHLNFILIPAFWLANIAIITSWQGYILSLIICIMNLALLTRIHINWKKLSYFSLGLIPALFATYLTSHIFSSGATADNHTIGLILCLRLYSIAVISFMYVAHMPTEKILLELMQRKLLPVTIGFGLMATFNAFGYFAQEFKRIQLAYQMRFQKRLYSPRIILPLLVAGARYAHHASISLFNRGLNSNRSYSRKITRIGSSDFILWVINIACIMIYYYQLTLRSY